MTVKVTFKGGTERGNESGAERGNNSGSEEALRVVIYLTVKMTEKVLSIYSTLKKGGGGGLTGLTICVAFTFR